MRVANSFINDAPIIRLNAQRQPAAVRRLHDGPPGRAVAATGSQGRSLRVVRTGGHPTDSQSLVVPTAAKNKVALEYVGRNQPAPLDWSRPAYRGVVSGLRNNYGRALSERVWPSESSRTPPAFAETLIDLARNCGGAP